MAEKTLGQAFERACAELAQNVGCPLSGDVGDWIPEDCPGPRVCDQGMVLVAQRTRCWKALCAGRNRVADEAEDYARATEDESEAYRR